MDKRIAVTGIPFDAQSSYMRGPASAPAEIRKSLFCGSANLTSETGIDLNDDSIWVDCGDLDFSKTNNPNSLISNWIADILERHDKILSLGGDHSIAYPILQAYSNRYPELTIVQLDAHPDLYDELDGNQLSHACPFARIMENGLAKRLVQVGIRTLNQHQAEQAERFNVEVIPAWNWNDWRNLDFDGPIYLSLDMDVFDPAYAPGVSHHEPGGVSSRDVLQLIKKMPGTLVGADIVELNPVRDSNGMTAMLAAKCLKEVVARLIA